MNKKMTNTQLIGLLAYVSLLISGLWYFLDLFGIGDGVLPALSYALLLIVVLWMAWDYAKDLSLVWRILYYVVAVLAIGGFLFGIGMTF